MGDILDLSAAENKAFVKELLNRRWRTSVDKNAGGKQLHQNGMVLSKKENSQVEVGSNHLFL